MLQTQGRSDVPDIIIFMTDGEANQPDSLQPCSYLNNKANDREGRRSDDLHDRLRGRGRQVLERDTSGAFRNAYASTNLAKAATNSIDDVPGGCGINENKDGDNYFCESGSGDLEPVFRQVAAATLGHSRLIEDL